MIGARLKEQREMAGLTQPQLAAAVGAAKRTVIDWEKGVTSPTGMQLAAMAELGIDVLYILTGQRSATPAAGSNHSAPNDLRPDQLALLDNYEHCAPEDRDAARRLLASAAQHRQTPPRKTKAQGG